MKLNKKDLPPTDGVWKHSSARWCSELNGLIHNSLGPAVVYDDGSKQWCVNGELHRLEGPAVEYADGDKEWWVSGKRVSEQGFSLAVISFLLDVDFNTAIAVEQEID